MDYKEAVKFFDSFVNYEKMGYVAKEPFKLDRSLRLADIFGNPQNTFSVIHIAGTKGKGSTANFIASILEASGFSVGLYTSPHILMPRERIKINGEIINEKEFAFYVGEIKEALASEMFEVQPTYFELYTILAFNYFRGKNVDFAVVETGLGGRLDATNIAKSKVSVISPISYDHMYILGDTLEKIAFEKCGIIKNNSYCVSAPQEKEALEVIKKRCSSLDTQLFVVGEDFNFSEISCDDKKEVFEVLGTDGKKKSFTSHLLGHHQLENATAAIAVAEILRKEEPRITGSSISVGIERCKNPGRCEIIEKRPYIVLDGAQNRKSAKALKDTIERNFDYDRLIVVLGISKDKDIKGVCEELAPLADEFIITKAQVKRAEEPAVIAGFIKNKNVILTKFVSEAMERAKFVATDDDMIVVAGSFFVVGEVKRIYDTEPVI